MGTIGVGEKGVLYQLIKKAYKSSGAKLKLKPKENILTAIASHCKYPIFLPLMVTLS